MEQNPCCVAVGRIPEAAFLPVFLPCNRRDSVKRWASTKKEQKLKPRHTTESDDLIRSCRGVDVVSIGSPRGAGVVGPIAAAQNMFAIRA